jgi:hypothetical protein
MELACENCEVPVGPFSADILARDLASDELVVIENQLERTNHDHFGKTLTYAAVLGAKTIVWVAKAFTEEHRKAVEWLNELTNGDLSIYGVELQVWRIGQSPPAPRFDVVCAPNEVVRAAGRARDSGEATPTRQLQLEFWTEVRTHLGRTGEFASLKAPRPQYWFDIAIGRAIAHLSLIANTWDRFVGVRLYMRRQAADAILAHVLPYREEIEHQIGAGLEWNPHPDKQDKIIRLQRPGDISDRNQWPELAGWLAETAVAFKRAFAPRIAGIDLSATSQPLSPAHTDESTGVR